MHKNIKKIIFGLLLFFISVAGVKADTIYNVDMKVDILKNGNANITEVWNVKASGGSEWYKQLNNLGNSNVLNYTVSMDGRELTKKNNWDVDASLKSKAGYYGINYTSDGLELCFGKSDMKRHTFTLNYTLTNFVFNTSDSQVVYFTLFPEVSMNNFSVEVSSYYSFPNTLDVWGYGYKGYAYVQNGKIFMSNEGDLKKEYVVLLARFPLNTFNTTNSYSYFGMFNDVYIAAEEDTFDYNYGNDGWTFFDVLIAIFVLSNILIPIILIYKSINNSYGYKDNKKIDKKNIPMFRDIPCDKDIYYANALINLNKFNYKESNILGAIILKWVRDKKISFKNEVSGIFNRETSVIDLTMNPIFDDELEQKLFDMMYKASKDGMLETKEFERWAKKNYSKFLDLFDKIENKDIKKLKEKGRIYKRKYRSECKKINVMDDVLYEESKKLYGLKKYLEEFSRIDTREVMEVHLWDEYLMFAYLFGIADKVAKQLKNMYPEVLNEIENIDYDTIIYVSNISRRSVSAASSARSAAQSYSSGGGGFSSGGGGGGSFGGGGSMGGR